MTLGANLELKARDLNPARSFEVCGEIGAIEQGTLEQVDTYFEVPHGRLKLREQAGVAAQLIAYQRAAEDGNTESNYRIVAVPDAAEMREALATALGVRVTVRKERRLFLWRGVRIHLDRVEGLGTFIEFEGVATADAGTEAFEPLLDDLRHSFGIDDEDLLAGSYSDLLEAQEA